MTTTLRPAPIAAPARGHERRRSRRTLTRGAGALLIGLALALAAVAPAGAHGGEAEMAVEDVRRDGDDVTVDVRFTYVGDGHGVPDATVTVVVDEGTPVPMEPGTEEGLYSATVAAEPGTLLRVTAVEPAASLEIEAPPAEEDPTEPETGSTTSEPEPTEPTTETSETSTTDPQGTSEVIDGGGDDSTLLVLGGITALLGAAAVVGIAMAMRSRKAISDTGSDSEGPAAGD